ncbi:hypothetical protein EVAR_19772_1 [Eumeta japonica]|uniref:Uncharacterized protein n=1 Tax=Eumeta variegata TaxID=151549 RepID=A0A4C1UR94_EUMVA|nr:hypothetical protein EVAR_19772_1 [Eumeta japonica]
MGNKRNASARRRRTVIRRRKGIKRLRAATDGTKVIKRSNPEAPRCRLLLIVTSRTLISPCDFKQIEQRFLNGSQITSHTLCIVKHVYLAFSSVVIALSLRDLERCEARVIDLKGLKDNISASRSEIDYKQIEIYLEWAQKQVCRFVTAMSLAHAAPPLTGCVARRDTAYWSSSCGRDR